MLGNSRLQSLRKVWKIESSYTPIRMTSFRPGTCQTGNVKAGRSQLCRYEQPEESRDGRGRAKRRT